MRGDIERRWKKPDRDVEPETFWTRYTEAMQTRKAPSTLRTEKANWDEFTKYLKPTTLGAVTPHHAQRLQRHLAARQSPATVNGTIKRLRSIYNYALDPHGLNDLTGENPFAKLRAIPAQAKERRALTKDQREALLAAAKKSGPLIHTFCALCVYAALRSIEAANARWEWIDWERSTVTV